MPYNGTAVERADPPVAERSQLAGPARYPAQPSGLLSRLRVRQLADPGGPPGIACPDSSGAQFLPSQCTRALS